MMPVSSVNSSAAQPLAAVGKILGVPEDQKPEETHGRPLKPVTDEYVPEEPQVPSGRYWPGRGEDGQPKIYFDNPERAADAPPEQDALPEAGAPDGDRDAGAPNRKASGDKAENCTCNTDKVDREIEKLKKKREELERQIHSETDDIKVKELEKKLAQVESELRQKDNDTYRRQHSVFS